MAEQVPSWQLPPGVTRGLWDYAHSETVAQDYDDYFAFNRLFKFDEQVVLSEFERRAIAAGSLVADLGCGTGRALVALCRHGYHGLAIDLSEQMLDIVSEKARLENLPIECLRGNLVELDEVADDSVDAAISLFSTLGMIRGREHRWAALRHVRRILRPRGPFILHVHNYWYNLYDPGGPWWLLRNLSRAILFRDIEAGDKFFNYRGVPNMFLHVFRLREIKCDLRRTGFQITRIIPLDPKRHRRLRMPWLLGNLRANGWIVICQ